jgi:DNA polymerase-3 subunit delta'
MARLIDSIQGHRENWSKLIAARDRHLPHGLAFIGPNGIGKKRVAFALAQALLCEKTSPSHPEPCGECGPCKRVELNQSESVLYIEPQANTIKLEAASQVLDFLALQRIGRARVVIVDQAQMLNPQTANALLKAIEEPPPETFFILLTAEISQLLPTLRSRLQSVRFSPLSESVLKSAEGVEEWMLKSARGSFETLEQFKDEGVANLRSLAIDFLKDASQDQRTALEKAQGEAKDRESALTFTRLLQQLLRDWSVLGAGTVIHGDLEKTLASLPAVESKKRVDLWQGAFQMEMDILAHVDRALCLENFYYRTRQALR